MKDVYGLVVLRVRLPTIGRNQIWNPVSRSFMLGKVSHSLTLLDFFYVSYEIIRNFDQKQVYFCLFAAKLRRKWIWSFEFLCYLFLG